MAKGSKSDAGRSAHLHASLALAFCALEAHLNSIADEMTLAAGVTTPELSILQERELRLDSGTYVLGGLKIYRTEDRIEFLFARFSKSKIEKNSGWWPGLSGAAKIRNKLVHPKGAAAVTEIEVQRAIESIVGCLDALYRAIYGVAFPAAAMGLMSSLDF